MRNYIAAFSCVLALTLSAPASADELVEMVQRDLAAMDYDPGNIDGEVSGATLVAISKFQAEHDIEVTGEVTPQLAGIIKAAGRGRYRPVSTGAPSAQPSAMLATPREDPESRDLMAAAQAQMDMQARQEACLQEKIALAKQRKKKKRGFGRLLRVAGRVAARTTLGIDVGQVTNDIYDVTATASDLSAAAQDLGLTEDDVEACRNPPVKDGQL